MPKEHNNIYKITPIKVQKYVPIKQFNYQIHE